VLAKSIVHRILEPAFRPELNLRVVCKESRSAEAFSNELAAQTMDVVLADAPAPRVPAVRMYSHPLGECGTSWFAAPTLARRLRRGFPDTIDTAPLLLPTVDSNFRHHLDAWFSMKSIRPSVVAELDDVALVAALGGKGLGLFAAADVLEDELKARYRVEVVGRTKQIRQAFYAISIERELKHPGVAAICASARKDLFD
jgi:LysR family transcriptional activator of nhaA